jgi:hypothetical protein
MWPKDLGENEEHQWKGVLGSLLKTVRPSARMFSLNAASAAVHSLGPMIRTSGERPTPREASCARSANSCAARLGASVKMRMS